MTVNRHSGSSAALPSSQKLLVSCANSVWNTRSESKSLSIVRVSMVNIESWVPAAFAALDRASVRSRKFASSSRPYSVLIDSGWNCTPHNGLL